jgi:hypothetical protein
MYSGLVTKGVCWIGIAVLVAGCSPKQATPESPAPRATSVSQPLQETKDQAMSNASGTESTADQWVGTVTAGMMAIGGETTGITLTTADVVFELRATGATLTALADSSGQRVTVRGRSREIAGVELRKRRIIDVEEIVEIVRR